MLYISLSGDEDHLAIYNGPDDKAGQLMKWSNTEAKEFDKSIISTTQNVATITLHANSPNCAKGILLSYSSGM